MHYPAFVQVAQRINNRTDDLPGLVLGVDDFLRDLVVEFTAREILQDKVDMLLVLKTIIELNDVGVGDVLHDVDFPLQQYLFLLVHLLPASQSSYFFMIFTAAIRPVFFYCAFITFANPPLPTQLSTRRWSRSRVARTYLLCSPPSM